MRLFLLLSVACTPPADLYPARVPAPVLDLGCVDTGSDCALVIPPVAWGRAGTATFTVSNDGHALLELTVTTGDAAFVVDPAEAVLDRDLATEFVVEYRPASFDAASTTVTLAHNGPGGALAFRVQATTDDDGDDDGHPHEDAPGGDDCNDQNPGVHPGAAESWYDGVDQDCDGGSDYDADGDGHDSDRYGGTDCDDADPRVHPGAPDPVDDEVDQDCDGADG